MCKRCFANPAAALVCALAGRDTFAVAWTVALQDLVELGPIDRPEAVVLARFVPNQVRVGNAQAKEFRLRYGDVDELLPQLVVGEALDLPAHRLRGVLRSRVVRAEHHQRWPPPTVERVLRHASLLRRAARERHHGLEALALMETLFLADAHHRARVRTVRAFADRDL